MVKAILVKSFSTDRNEGNPAGVVLDSSNLNDTQMQHIARELGYSETAFVEPSVEADYKVRFFAVQQEVDFCGHATVATFHSLVWSGVITPTDEPVTITQKTGIGVIPVTVFSDGRVMMTQKEPKFGRILEDRDKVAKLLNIETSMLGDFPVQIVSTGVKKLIVPITNLKALQSIKPSLHGIVEHGGQNGYSGVSVFSTESYSGMGDMATRNFSPSVGINEDPATGIAAGPLACYLKEYMHPDSLRFEIEQGFDMGMPSRIFVDLTDGVDVGGYAVAFGERDFRF